MADKKQITVGILIVLILTSAVYITFSDKIRMRVDNDQTTFYMPHETYSWIWTVVGRETNSIFDGTSKMNRNSSGIMVWTEINEATEDVYIYRETNYLRGPKILDTYYFNGNVKNIELFPISHTIEIWNASGKFYRYEARDLIYDGPTEKLIGITEKEFGRNMKIEWEPDYRWAWVYQDGILKVQYDIDSDYEKFNIRLFDPATVTLVVPVNDTYSLDLTQTFTCNYSADFGVTNLSLYIWNSTGDVYYLNTQYDGEESCYQESADVVNQSGTDGNCVLEYTGNYSGSSNFNDGNWSTKGAISSYSHLENVTYKVPAGYIDAEFKIKYMSAGCYACVDPTPTASNYTYNVSSCISDGVLDIYYVSGEGEGGGGADIYKAYCGNNQQIFNVTTSGIRCIDCSAASEFYEEGITWDINNTLEAQESWNVTFTRYDNYTWNCLAT